MKRPEACAAFRESLIALACLAMSGTILADNARNITIIDGHAHYVAADAEALPPAAVVARLDGAGVSRLAVTATPPELAQALYRQAPARIIPLLGVYGDGLDKANWMQDGSLPRRTAARLETGRWAGIGELHLFARDADNPVFAELVRLAESRQLVLMLHGDAEVVERAFELAPGLRVLWAHLGTEPRPEILARMLERYPAGLWIDTSVRDERIAPGGRLLPEWQDLFVRHPERFLVAVDTFSTRRWLHYEAVTTQIRAWVEPLPEPLRSNLLFGNAARLFSHFPPASVPQP